VARYAVIGVRTIGALVAQTPVHLEEAAATAGAGFARRLSRILVPLHARGVGFAWLLALVFCLRDLELAALYYPAGGEPLTVRIFTLEANGPEPVVAALAVVHVAMTAAVLGVGGWLLRRSAA
jgi:iron(III) transport system permease protein